MENNKNYNLNISQLTKPEKNDLIFVANCYITSVKNNGERGKSTIALFNQIDTLTNKLTPNKAIEYAGKLHGKKDEYLLKLYKQCLNIAEINSNNQNRIEKIKFPYTSILKTGEETLLNHSDNTETLFKYLNISIKYNELIKDIEINIPYKKFHGATKNTATLTVLKDICHNYDLPCKDIESHIVRIGNNNVYHPVKDWMDKLNWDGKSRINDLLNSVILDDNTSPDIAHLLLSRWLIMAVAAIYKPNKFSPQGVLTFVGKQGIGKTTWIKTIVPDSNWLTTDMQINPSVKDDVIAFVKNWIVELGELDATFKRSDLAALKSFITRDNDTFRAPFGKKQETHPRQTVFYASVNDYKFLQDDENRRYWPFGIISINTDHNINIEQLWAEIKVLYEKGKPYWLSHDELELLNKHNKKFTTIHPAVERVLNKLYNPIEYEGIIEELNCTNILIECGIKNPNKSDTGALAKYLRANNFEYQNNGKRTYKIILSSLNNTPKKKKYTKDNENVYTLL